MDEFYILEKDCKQRVVRVSSFYRMSVMTPSGEKKSIGPKLAWQYFYCSILFHYSKYTVLFSVENVQCIPLSIEQVHFDNLFKMSTFAKHIFTQNKKCYTLKQKGNQTNTQIPYNVHWNW